MERTLPSLHSVWHRRGWVAVLALLSTLSGAGAYLFFTAPKYEVKARLILNDRQLGISELSRSLSEVSSYRTGESSPLATQSELIKSQRVIQEAMDRVNIETLDPLAVPPTLKQVRKHLKIAIIPATNILEVTYQNESEVLAVEVLNSIAQTMVDESAREIRLEAKAVREFLEQEVPRQRQITEAAERAENDYRRVSGLVNVEEQTAQLVGSLGDLEAQERTLVAEYQERITQVEQLRQLTGIDNPKNAYIGRRVGGDQEIEEMRSQLAQVDAELATARSRFTDENPIVQSLAAQRQALVELYQQKLAEVVPPGETLPRQGITSDELSENLIADLITAQSQSVALADRIRALRGERQNLLARLDELPLKQQPLMALVRQREEAEETLRFLQGKLEEARLAETQLLGNIRIIELAEEGSGDETPSAAVVLVLATAFGVMLAVGLVVLLEIMDNTLHDDGEIEELLKLPLLGVLPTLTAPVLKLTPPNAFLDNGRFVEPYRLLLKTLEFRSADPLKRVVISSAIASEGKSTIAAHLAAVSALLGRRTLIIDADLRCPQQHRIWQREAQPGLTESLNGDRPLSQSVQATEIDNLYLLPCGELTPHPSKLLESARLHTLLEEAAQTYDLVIIDTPPISSCGDAHTLSRDSNGLLLITRPNVTPKDILIRLYRT
ncbi:polysaccharide biosynthesis tyrosine autokinase [Roseofilum sp. BLCC_M154]|uniref:non-specific protein-tyrosine kinase n=1 Tax=Roseofilum acuticapitatum BLCC-M154 TaxID=3022444 RepID=A0ABT7AXK6_9CYAN|nr:polysaccharide biosynthesis tyrosine autokinase [Roseofilum acuticapitatum]MDJ1171647.1 polysaccharide biosynthesis tyrosine autokinase [Roseofilum acuticapitatum BLCC-M154]